MNFTLREIELAHWTQEAADYAALPAALKAERTHYWHIERRSKRKKAGQYQWIFERELFATKSKAAELFVKHYRNQPIRYRLVHKLKY